MEKVINKIGYEDRSKYEWTKNYKAIYERLDSKTKASKMLLKCVIMSIKRMISEL